MQCWAYAAKDAALKNESYKLIRDLFHALSIGALGVALFSPDTLIEWRVASALFGFYCHLIAHVLALYDRLRNSLESDWIRSARD